MMRAKSAKTVERDRWYGKLRGVLLPVDVWTECERCGGEATEVQHAMGRAPSVMLNVATWRFLCGPCHRFVTDHPARGRAEGFVLHRNGAIPELTKELAVKTCRSCRAEIVWALTENGKSIPLDACDGVPLPHPGGDNGRIVPTGERRGEAIVVEILEKDAQVESLLGTPEVWVSHFATCPDAKSWKKS